MIMISFNGAVTGENMDMYAALFKSGRVNPNGCSVKGTFFVSHKYTNYSAVTELHRQGHEVGIIKGLSLVKYFIKSCLLDRSVQCEFQ